MYRIGTPSPQSQRPLATPPPRLPVREMLTVRQLVEASLAEERLLARISTVFGILSLGLGCLGIYGVIAFLVARQTREIGIRMALGATRATIVRTVFAEGALLGGGELPSGCRPRS